jgi:hypothetical protein
MGHFFKEMFKRFLRMLIFISIVGSISLALGKVSAQSPGNESGSIKKIV